MEDLMRHLYRSLGGVLTLAVLAGCSEPSADKSGATGTGGLSGSGGSGISGSSGTGTGGSGAGTSSGGSSGTSTGGGAGSATGGSSGTGSTGLPTVPGTPDTSVTTALPPLPSFQRVTASATGDSVSISVEPIEGAKDYRVYVLPADSAITPGENGAVTVQDAVYRCAGNRQTPRIAQDGRDKRQSEAFFTQVDGQSVSGYRRTLADATLGYVYVNPGEGRIPVYAMGDPSADADNSCYWQRWAASRVKRYVTSEAERADLLSQRWRDDGIAFYIPAATSALTKPVYATNTPLYYVDGPEANARSGRNVAFNILAAPELPATVPLMRVFYDNACGRSHDELAAGVPRFERARFQGDELPMFDLLWSGITGETVLVVEALDVGCPFQGVLASASRPSGGGGSVDYPAFMTLDQLHAASPTGEVFLNGQHPATNAPRPIARSFIRISPGPKPEMDWFAGFGPDETLPDFNALGFNEPCDDPTNPTCTGEHRQVSDFADISLFGAEKQRTTVGTVLGQLLVTYADIEADVAGKFRLTPPTKGTMSASSYLHVTMEVDAFSTARRYPQMLVSEAEAPIHGRMSGVNTIILQTFTSGMPNWPINFDLELCSRRYWEVNDQCPTSQLYQMPSNTDDPNESGGLMPMPEAGELTGVDRSTKLDAFLSTARAYLFIDGQPFGCIELPSTGVPTGEVTITFGDALYHSGVDEVFSFHRDYQQVFARRHFDNLGFKSGAQAPTWDHDRFPCFPSSAIRG
ncbi:MAG TPA: hypothetical protein VFZ53_23110 [Polyangiaceae bacterium]